MYAIIENATDERVTVRQYTLLLDALRDYAETVRRIATWGEYSDPHGALMRLGVYLDHYDGIECLLTAVGEAYAVYGDYINDTDYYVVLRDLPAGGQAQV